MSQPPYGGYPPSGGPPGGDPYGGGYDPYGQQPPEQIPGWTPAPTQGGSGYQGVPDPYGPPQYAAAPYGQQPQYGGPPYGQPPYGQPQGGPPPPRKNAQLPWIIVAVVAILGLGAAVLIVVLNKDGSTTVAGPTSPQTSISASEPTSEETSEKTSEKTSAETSEQTSKETSSSAKQPTEESLVAQTKEFMNYLSKANPQAKIYVCGTDQPKFVKAQEAGNYTELKDATYTVATPTLDDKLALVDVAVTATTGAKETYQLAMSFSGSFWYWCPSDQPGVGTQI